MTLEERIQQQQAWTFRECLGLAAEFNVKVRVVVVTVYACGKDYLDGEEQGDEQGDEKADERKK